MEPGPRLSVLFLDAHELGLQVKSADLLGYQRIRLDRLYAPGPNELDGESLLRIQNFVRPNSNIVHAHRDHQRLH